MKDARQTAAEALMRMEAGNAYSNLALEPMLRQNGLMDREAAFASALFYTALERRLTADHILGAYSKKPLEALSPPVLTALRLGVCQLFWMDGVDDYAAVDESVELVKKLGGRQAAGFVNAVLRSVLRAGKELPTVKGGVKELLSVRYSCPVWLVRRLMDTYGTREAEGVLAASLGRPPLYIRANTLRLSAQELREKLAERGIDAVEQTPEGCLRVDGRLAVETLDLFAEGLFHVQDRASQLCAAALEAGAGDRVLDVCAAPGGKTFTIAQRMENQGELVARDLHERRVKLIRAGAERLGLTVISARAGDAGKFDGELGLFDRVLCDAPCSGFGTIRRKPEIKYKPAKTVENLPDIQYKILKTSSQYLNGGGRLVYSTCTLLPEENERVVERFLRENGGFRLMRSHTYLGSREDGDSDGFFVAVIERT